jgi:hypothetical protein
MNEEQGGVKTWQWVVTVLVIIVLILLGYYMFKGDGTSTTDDMTNTPSSTISTDANRVVITDQFPGNIVYVSSVQLENPGFVVIKKDNAGTPGDVIGSQYFDKGINPGKVTLKTPTVEGGTYYAVIYSDTDGNKVFDAAKDMPLKDAAGNIIMKIFRATSSSTEMKG